MRRKKSFSVQMHYEGELQFEDEDVRAKTKAEALRKVKKKIKWKVFD